MINIKLMLVEDDEILQERLYRILSREVKEIVSFSSASEALKSLEKEVPDLIITDIKMPGITGLEMISIIRRSFPTLPVIIASAFSQPNYFLDAIKSKVENFIVKPIDVDELIENIQKVASKLEVEKKLKENEALLNQYKNIVDISANITITDKKGTIIYVNDKFAELSGYSYDELIGANHRILRHPDMEKAFFKDLWDTILQKKIWQGIIKNKKKDGSSFYVDTTISPILDSNNRIKEFISIKVDVTELITSRKKLESDIIADQLTGLPNRLALQSDLRSMDNYTIMLINLDRFKTVNLLFGIHFGDMVLEYFARAMQNVQKSPPYRLYRITADEFIVLSEKSTPSELEKAAHDIKKNIDLDPFRVEEVSFNIGFTAVIMYGNKSEQSPVELLQHIMEQSKRENKFVTIYSTETEIEKLHQDNFQWTQKIKSALAEERIRVFYQPIYDIKKKEITKYESLVRLIEPDGKVVSPYFFLNAAKSSRLYTDITKTVIRMTCETCSKRSEFFSVNLSIEDLTDEGTLDFLLSMVKHYNLQNRLIVEVLESEGIDNFDVIQGVFLKLTRSGIRIAIDDFGSGYSNFSYLANLSVSILKIDGSLIKNIVTDYSTKVIVQSIVMFAKELGMKCVAEYVADKAIFNVIKTLNIDLAQGFYIGEPAAEIVNSFDFEDKEEENI